MTERIKLKRVTADDLTIRITEEELYHNVELLRNGRVVAATSCDANKAAAKHAGQKLKAQYLHDKL